MSFSVEFAFRIIGAVAGAIGAGKLGQSLARFVDISPESYVVILGLVGFLAGLVLTPYVTTRPMVRMRRGLADTPPGRLAAVIVGIFLGLVAAALFSLPLSLLPSPFRQIMPLAAALFFCYLSVVIMTSRQDDLQALFNSFRASSLPAGAVPVTEGEDSYILLDTSVIIDGRIADISKTGFIRTTLLVPNFVLSELQHIADSSDRLRRNRGRRGLEILSKMQNESPIPILIADMDVSEVRDVDSKLVALARNLHCPIMTNDYNLNRVAELQGVTVLNINDLTNAVKAAYLPGEELRVKIIQDGKEAGQGVGYLEDGTMVVVEDGHKLINKTLNVTVTKVLQTTAGRMIFAKP
ncbi:MAG: PIN/TRAM domain-containing protein [Anaerolineae bacterium]